MESKARKKKQKKKKQKTKKHQGLGARLGPTLSHEMPQGLKKNVARSGLEPRVSRLPCEHRTVKVLLIYTRTQIYICPKLSTFDYSIIEMYWFHHI